MTETNLPGKTTWESQQYRTDGGMHARLAQGLIDMGHYIRTHPDLPIPADVQVHYCVPAATDKAGEDELHRIAVMLIAAVTGDEIGETHLNFGPVQYSATYISRDHMAAYQAHMAPYAATQAERRAAATERRERIRDAAAEVHARIQPRGEAA